MTRQPHTIGCRVSGDELSQIESIIQATGQSRAEWLYGLIHREITGTDYTTVRGLAARIAAIEQRLSKLFK
jgi:hypothetical protein